MIKDLKTLREFFQEKVTTPIFGVGVYAFNRLGPEEFIDNYRLLCLRYSLDTTLIEKDLEVFSLEKGMGIYHLDVPRNSTSVLAHERTKAYLKRFKNPLIIPYKPSTKMLRRAEENDWRVAANPMRFGKKLFEDKIKFRRLLERLGVAVPEGEIRGVRDLNFEEFKKRYGLPFFVQHPKSGGGKGNFLISEWRDFVRMLKDLKEMEEKRGGGEVLVARFIRGSSPSLTGCVTKYGILSTSLQDQILDADCLFNKPGRLGLFCGHDWTKAKYGSRLERQADEIVEKVGQHFKKLGYKGIFGLDFVLDERRNKLYVVECNPRLLGSFPTITMAQIRNGEPPILGFHLLEFLGIDYELDVEAVKAAMRVRRLGAQMLLHNLEQAWAETTKQIRPGVYRLRRGKLKYLRRGYKLSHLRKKYEFLITEGVPVKGSFFSPNRRLVRILCLRGVLKEGKELTPWARKVAKIVYNSFGMRKIRFSWLKRLLNRKYLRKG